MIPPDSLQQEFVAVLASEGVTGALRFLNKRTPHRFTGIYRFDPPVLRNLYLVDAFAPETTSGDDAPMTETYCSIVGASERPFTTPNARLDDRLASHPARDSVISYCGVLLRAADGEPFGTLCHFDLKPCDVPVAELPMMEYAAPLLVALLPALL